MRAHRIQVDMKMWFAAAAVVSSSCVTVEHAPKSMQKEQMLVRAWVAACAVKTTIERGAEGVEPCALPRQGRRIQGVLLHLDADSLTLLAWREADPAVVIPVARVDSVQLYRGKVPSLKAAVKGAAIGALTGAVLGGAVGGVTGAVFGDGDDVAEAAGKGLAAGAGYGAILGAAEGIFEGDDHWEALPLTSLRTLYCHTNDRARCLESEGDLAERVAVDGL